MDKELAETIIEAITIHGFEGELREDYLTNHDTGTCGVITDCNMGQIAAAIINNAELFLDIRESIENIRSNHMGLDNIYY